MSKLVFSRILGDPYQQLPKSTQIAVACTVPCRLPVFPSGECDTGHGNLFGQRLDVDMIKDWRFCMVLRTCMRRSWYHPSTPFLLVLSLDGGGLATLNSLIVRMVNHFRYNTLFYGLSELLSENHPYGVMMGNLKQKEKEILNCHSESQKGQSQHGSN